MLHHPRPRGGSTQRSGPRARFDVALPLSEVNNNNIVMMQHHYYRTHPASNGGHGGGHGGRRNQNGQPGRGGHSGQGPGRGHQEIILHPALFGGAPPRPMPNLLPRYAPPQLMGPPGGPGPPPPGHHGGPPREDPFIEEQVEVLAEKIEGLEGELRYAWRALDVLSQEYVKMWQRLEKMEGLLSEQQTVITQLIDLYSADSSDNGLNSDRGLDKDCILSPSSIMGGIQNQSTHHGGLKSSVNDENFYKALNAVHGESANTEMQLALSASQSIDDFASPGSEDRDCEDPSDEEEDHSGKVVLPPHPIVKSGANSNFTDFLKGFDEKPTRPSSSSKPEGAAGKHRSKSKSKKSSKMRRSSQGSESDFDVKSMSSSVRSSISANTVRSEDVADFPLPGELSPTYENATPPTPPTISQFPKKPVKKDKKSRDSSHHHPKGQKGGDKSKQTSSEALTVIGGKYSFNINNEGQQSQQPPTASGQPSASKGQSAASNETQREPNGKPLYPSLQTAMQPQNSGQSSSGLQRPDQPSVSKKSSPEQQVKSSTTPVTSGGRKLSLKEKRKLRAEKVAENIDLQAASHGGATPTQPQPPSGPTGGLPGVPEGVPEAPNIVHSSTREPPTKLKTPPKTTSSGSEESSVSPNNKNEVPLEGGVPGGTGSGGSSNGGGNGNGQLDKNGVLMRTTSREFAVSRALGKYREKQKKVQQQHRSSVGSNSDSQEDLDVVGPPSGGMIPPGGSKTGGGMAALAASPAALAATSAALRKEAESSSAGDEADMEPLDYNEEAELEQFNNKLAQFGDSIDQNILEANEGSLTGTTTEDEFGPPLPGQMPKQRPPVESSSSEAVFEDKEYAMQQEAEEAAEAAQQEAEAKEAARQAEADAQRRREEEMHRQRAAAELKQAEEAAKKAADQAAKVAKTAFGLFGASKFGKFAREAAAQAQVAAKEQQQKISAPPSQNPSRTGSR